MGDILSDLLTPSGNVATWGGAFWRLGQSCALGLVVAALYRSSVARRDGAPGLTGTLLMLTMLITMVTVSVQSTPAAAFALFGTLAIVRFRTRVRDIRDTAFVIFAVVVGLTVGADETPVAFAGTVAVGLVTFIITRIEPTVKAPTPARRMARLTLRTDTLDFDRAAIAQIIDRYTAKCTLSSVRTNKVGTSMRLSYDIATASAEEATALIQALTEAENITRARISL